MAEVIKRAQRHNCHEEIKEVDVDLYLGSIVKCSCGKQYIKRDDQRDGLYWAEMDANSSNQPNLLGTLRVDVREIRQNKAG